MWHDDCKVTRRIMGSRRIPHVCAGLLTAAGLLLPAVIVSGQQGPIAALFGDEKKRGALLSSSFLTVGLPSTPAAGFPAHVYLFAGDLERAFDNARFRPDAAIVPTNTDLLLTATSPATQRILVDRVRKQRAVMRDLQDQIELRRKQSPDPRGATLNVAVDSVVVKLPRQPGSSPPGAFPRTVCLIATDFAKGGAIDRRELFSQDRVRKGIASCLTTLDAMGVQSLIVPFMGASSSENQSNDAVYEGQRVLKECRLMNSVAGIALGIHDFAPNRRSLREIGIVQWDRELVDMFGLPQRRLAPTARSAYQTYADQIADAMRHGLAGGRTTANDTGGQCSAIFDPE
jgi:hypothetical protein